MSSLCFGCLSKSVSSLPVYQRVAEWRALKCFQTEKKMVASSLICRVSFVSEAGAVSIFSGNAWPSLGALHGTKQPKTHLRHALNNGNITPLTSDEELNEVLTQAEEKGCPIIIEWMAQWCRKCIYLAPKLEKLSLEYPDIPFYVIDVNKVPSSLVRRANVTKMPTIQLWKSHELQAEVIGGHKAWMVLDEIKEMIRDPKKPSS